MSNQEKEEIQDHGKHPKRNPKKLNSSNHNFGGTQRKPTITHPKTKRVF